MSHRGVLVLVRTVPVVVAALAGCRGGSESKGPSGAADASMTPSTSASWVEVDDRDRRLFWRLAQSVTRERRFTRGRSGAASSLRIVVRPWQRSDGGDPLRVLAAPPATTEAP